MIYKLYILIHYAHIYIGTSVWVFLEVFPLHLLLSVTKGWMGLFKAPQGRELMGKDQLTAALSAPLDLHLWQGKKTTSFLGSR